MEKSIKFVFIMDDIKKELIKKNNQKSFLNWVKSVFKSGSITKEEYEKYVKYNYLRNIIAHGTVEEVNKIEITDSIMNDCKDLLQRIKNENQ